jgi:sugar diacid utilization regulator
VSDFFVCEDNDGPRNWADIARENAFPGFAGQGRMPDGESFPVHIVSASLTGQTAEIETILYVVRSGYGLREAEALRRNDETQQRADLLNAIADGEISASEVAIERGRSLGMDLSARYALFAISIDNYEGKSYAELQKDQHGMKEVLRQVTHICSAEQDKIVWTRYDGFAVLCPLPESCTDSKSHAMARAKSGKDRVIRQMPGVKLTVGVSSSYADVLDIRRCYREAKEAANVGRRVWGGNDVYHYADLGICQLLTQFQDAAQLHAFVDRSLGKLIQQDAAKGTQLVETLEEILSASNLKEAAERSFVHHKTILARKNRIEAVLGVSIDDVETRLTLSTAMKILRLLP